MATIAVVRNATGQDGPMGSYSWLAMTANDVGQALFVGHRPGKSVQAIGTFGGAITLRGSNKPAPNPTVAADWFSLTNPNTSTPISFTSGGGNEVMESCLWVSPAAAAGVTAVDVHLLATSARAW